jgi:glycosyltransferase involved in cell wall biosynthesis
MSDESNHERDRKPGLAIISNEQTPYRLHFHRRIAAEIPELCLWSVFTHELASSPWQYTNSEAINSVLFGSGEPSAGQSKMFRQVGEWQKGGAIIRWMRSRNIRAVVVLGYNDAGRLRVIEWCRRNGVPCLLFGDSNIRADALTGWKAFVKRLFLGKVVRACSGLLCCGRLGREYFLKYGARSEAIFAMPYEPDYDVIRNVGSKTLETVRERFQLREGRRYLLFCGRLEHVKRVDLLIRAFLAVADDRPEWDLIIAGGGSLRAQLESLAPSNLTGRLVWAGFINDHEILSAVYTLSDVFVLPSDYEPWGVVLSEAATCLALVASSVVGAAAELVSDHVNGRIFPKGDLNGLCDALVEVTDPSRIDSMKAASPRILQAWRSEADPVCGLRRALQYVGALTAGDDSSAVKELNRCPESI